MVGKIIRTSVFVFMALTLFQAVRHVQQGRTTAHQVVVQDRMAPVSSPRASPSPVETEEPGAEPAAATSFARVRPRKSIPSDGAYFAEAEETTDLIDDLAAQLGGTAGDRWVLCEEEDQCTAFMQIRDLPHGTLVGDEAGDAWRAMRAKGSLPFALTYEHDNEAVFAFGDRDVALAEARADNQARVVSHMMETGLTEEEALRAYGAE